MPDKYIVNMTEKTTPEDTNLLVIEDAADTKKITFTNLFKPIKDMIGNLASLTTNHKTSVVGAINEHSAKSATQSEEGHIKLPEAPISATLQNGWVPAYAGTEIRYYKDEFGLVHVNGEVKDGITTNLTVITNLPVGYRPRIGAPTFCIKANDASLVPFQINASGDLVIFGLGYTTGTYRINGSFVAV